MAASQPNSSKVAASVSPPDDLQKRRADAIAAWGRLPAQLAQDDVLHRKKQLEDYAAYKAREGLLDPQSDIPNYGNKDSLTPNADIHAVKSLQNKIPEYGEKETLTSSTDKDVAMASDLRGGVPRHEGGETLVPTGKVATESLIAGAEAGDKGDFQVCSLVSRHTLSQC